MNIHGFHGDIVLLQDTTCNKGKMKQRRYSKLKLYEVIDLSFVTVLDKYRYDTSSARYGRKVY